jgi:hypothetical protein
VTVRQLTDASNFRQQSNELFRQSAHDDNCRRWVTF